MTAMDLTHGRILDAILDDGNELHTLMQLGEATVDAVGCADGGADAKLRASWGLSLPETAVERGDEAK